VCGASILTHRALEMGAVLGQALAEGHVLGFGTLTMRHRQGQPLKALWEAAGAAWGDATKGRPWERDQAAYGLVGWVRVWEVTIGRNGWHVHVHFVAVLRAGVTAADFDALASGMFGRWSRKLVRAGLEAPGRQGQEWHIVDGDQAAAELGEYLFKFADQQHETAAVAKSLGLELTHTVAGRSRDALKTRPVWSLVDEFASTGDVEPLGLWHEWEGTAKGKRQVGWSKGIRAKFAPDVEELSDEEVADQEVGTVEDTVARLSKEGWAQLVRIPGGPLEVIEALEGGGVPAMCQALDGFGVPYELVAAR
jgi:hypothetical protein